MANKDAAFGLKPIGKIGQNADNQGLTEYLIADNYASSIYQGDPVKAVAGGTVEVAAAENTNLVGVFWGQFITKDPTTGKPTYRNYYTQTNVANGEEIRAFVYDDPYERFEIQSNNASASAATDVFELADIEYTAGSTINGVSKVELDDASFVTTSAQLQVVGVSKDIENNDLTSANVNFVVRINEHLYKQTVGV
jgi:hypothetical protein